MNKLTSNDVTPDELVGRRCRLVRSWSGGKVIRCVEGTLLKAELIQTGRGGYEEWWLDFGVVAEFLEDHEGQWLSVLETMD